MKNTENIKIKVLSTVKYENVENAMECGNIGDWCRKWETYYSPPPCCTPYQPGWMVVLTEQCEDTDEPQVHTKSYSDLLEGLTVMSEKYPHHFADLMGGYNIDAITGACLIQCMVFGEMRYG